MPLPSQQEQSHTGFQEWVDDVGKPSLWVRSLLFSRADVWRVRLYMSQARAAWHQPLLPTLTAVANSAAAHADPDLSCLYGRKEGKQ